MHGAIKLMLAEGHALTLPLSQRERERSPTLTLPHNSPTLTFPHN